MVEATVDQAPAVSQQDSLRKRYLVKLTTNVGGVLISLVTAGIVPRALGPAAYGSFGFLSNFFSQVVGFLDGGSSIGFYNKLSQRQKEPGLIRFYWGFVAVVTVVLFLFVGAAVAGGLHDLLWPGQATFFVWLAVVWALLVWYSQILNSMLDAYALTVHSEIARLVQRILGAGLLLLMFWLGWLNLTGYFLYSYLLLLTLGVAWWWILKKNGQALFPSGQLDIATIRKYTHEFYDYTAPLVTYSALGLLVGLADRWLLQTFAGSVEQGFYGLSYAIGAFCFLFTSALIPLLQRELSIAHGKQDLREMRTLFNRYARMMYAVTAFFAVFVAIQAAKVGLVLGGSQFKGAALAISIMAFYPIHQTYGQLAGSVFFATGQTKLYRNIGMSILLLGLPVTFWLIAPQSLLGLELGATGLALKMVAVNIVSVNLLLWFDARLLHFSFWRLLAHEIYSVALLIVVAKVTAIGADWAIENTLLALLVSGFGYVIGCGGLLFLFPAVFGMTRAELTGQLTQLAFIARREIRRQRGSKN